MSRWRLGRTALAAGAVLTALAVGSWLPAEAASEDTERVIVVLHDDAVSPTAASVAAKRVADTVQGDVVHVYSHALQGFAADIPADEVDALAQHPSVAYVIPDFEIQASAIDPAELTSGIDRIEADRNTSASPVNVDIAIIDSGISFPHPDLNVFAAVDCLSVVVCGPGNVHDEHGHGTHVAGIAAAHLDGAGITGVAPGARLWSVRVLDAGGVGSFVDLLAGIDYVTANSSAIEVANLSLGFELDFVDPSAIDVLNQAVADSLATGIVYVGAAGNDLIPASQTWPASNPSVIAVSAIADGDGKPGGLVSPSCMLELDDTLADFSNFGPAVDIAAPGVCIISTWLDGTYEISSGTSMASPFVAGAVARYIAESGINPSTAAGVSQVRSAIIGAGVTGACGFTDEFDGVEEPLLFVNGPLFGGDGTCDGISQQPPSPPPPPPPPPPQDLREGVGVVDQGSGLWTMRRPDGQVFSFFFGDPGDVPFMGDWDCDGIDTPGLYRQSDGFVYLRNTNTQGIADVRFFFGNPGDLPLAGDFDADGCDTVSIYRSSEARWYVINELGANNGGLGAADYSYLFGDQGDIPFVGDWNGDGIDTPGLRRFSNGFVYIRNTNSSGNAEQSWFYGDNGDHVFTGDYDGDGIDSIGLYRPANTTIYLRDSLSTGNANDQFQIGTPNSKPVAGQLD